MAQPAPAKRRRRSAEDSLSGLLHVGNVSNVGLQDLLSKIRADDELPDKNLRFLTDAAFHSKFDRICHTERMPLKEGGGFFEWNFCEPALLMQEMVAQSPMLQSVYERALQQKPFPWNLVVAFDEYIPGNKLSTDNRRKVMVLSFNFLEVGAMLSIESTWFTCVAVRSSEISKVRGGWPSFLKTFLRRQLLGPFGLGTSGVAIQLQGRPQLLKATLSNLLSDGDGLRSALDWKGSSGLKPCFKHWNIFKKGSDLAHRRQGYFEIDCCDVDAFKTSSPKDIAVTVGLLAAASAGVTSGAMTKTAFSDLESMHGVNYNADGLIADKVLRTCFNVVGVCTYDWIHNSFQDGVFTTEAWLFLGASGVESAVIQRFLQGNWCFPRATRSKGQSLHRVFNSYRSSSSAEAERLKCSASEMMGLYDLLRHFVEVKITRVDVAAQRASFYAACECIDIILSAKRGITSPPQAAAQLKVAQRRHMEAHLAAYGNDHLKPKHHWEMDIAEQIERDGRVLDTLVVERMHLRVKRVSERIVNTLRFERSVLSGVVNLQFRSSAIILSDMHGLRGKTAEWQDATVADSAEYFGWHVFGGDVVLRGREAGKVIACGQNEYLFVVVNPYLSISDLSSHSQRGRLRNDQVRWKLSDISPAAAWYDEGDLTVILTR